MKPRKKLHDKDRVTKDGEILRQAYARIFPDQADRMRLFRKSVMNLSQKQLAAECGLTSSSISRMECGYGLPKGTTLIKFAKGVGISSDYLLGLSSKREITR